MMKKRSVVSREWYGHISRSSARAKTILLEKVEEPRRDWQEKMGNTIKINELFLTLLAHKRQL